MLPDGLFLCMNDEFAELWCQVSKINTSSTFKSPTNLIANHIMMTKNDNGMAILPKPPQCHHDMAKLTVKSLFFGNMVFKNGA